MPVEDFLYSQFINVTDYGAAPDGTDSSPAFQQALDAANGRPIFIPAGTFALNSPLTVTAPGTDHGQGPKFLGEGQEISVLDYKGSGSFLTCNQTLGYKFLKNGYLSNFTVSGRSNTTNQHAFSLTGAWDWYFDNLLIKNFTGDAIRSPLTSAVLTPLSNVSKRSGSNELTRTSGGFLTVLRVGDGISGIGIPLGSVVIQVVSDFIFRISAACTITEVGSIFAVGNTDAIQSIVHLRDTTIFNNGGYGVAGYSGLGFILNWKNTKVQANGGGVAISATCDIDGGVIAGNGAGLSTPGLRVTKVSGVPQNLSIRKIEFDSNFGSQIKLDYASNVDISQCRLISHLDPNTNLTMIPNKGIHIGGALGAAAVKNLNIDHCAFRADAQGGIPYEAIVLGDTGTYADVTVNEPLWITLTGPNQKKINKQPHPDASFRMIESGKITYGNPVSQGHVYARVMSNIALPSVAETSIPFTNVVRGDATIVTMGMPYTGLWVFDVSVSVNNLLVNETGTLTLKVGSVTRSVPWASNGQTSITVQANFSVVLNQGSSPIEVKFRRNGGSGVSARVNFSNDATNLTARFIG